MESTVKYKIGFWLIEKKRSKLKLDQVSKLLEIKGYELVHIKNAEDFENKGPFLVIFHKISDLNILLKEGNQEAEKIIKSFKNYLKNYPLTRVLDPIEKTENLIDRNRQYQIVLECIQDNDLFSIPKFVEFKTKNKEENIKILKDAGLNFPFVCKPIVAHGSQAHHMSLIFCEKGLDDIETPCVAQSFVNHSGKLYKLFCIKNNYFVVERPSLKNFQAGEELSTIHFDTAQISKNNSACDLNKISKEDEIKLNNRKLNMEILDEIVKAMQKCFELTLFGIDVIIDDLTEKYEIIDINSFPAYDGVENFVELFCDLLVEEAKICLLQNYDQLLKEGSFGFTDKILEEKSKIEKYSSSNLPSDLIYSKFLPFEKRFFSQNENSLKFKDYKLREKIIKNNNQ